MNSFLLSVNNSFRSLILFSNPLYVVVEQWSKTNWGKKSWIVEFEFTCPGNTWWLSIVGNTPKHRLRLLDRNTGRGSTPTRTSLVVISSVLNRDSTVIFSSLTVYFPRRNSSRALKHQPNSPVVAPRGKTTTDSRNRRELLSHFPPSPSNGSYSTIPPR